MQSREKALKIAELIHDKKAADIVILDISKITLVADFFVIASGGSALQIRALADTAAEKMKELGEAALRIEGYRNAMWLLIDFGSVILHIFSDEARRFYDLERLWGDAPRVDFKPLEED